MFEFLVIGSSGGGESRWSLLRENKTPGGPIQRVLENDFVVVTGTGTARDFIRLLTVKLH